jgi:putative Holliday junction resolvase
MGLDIGDKFIGVALSDALCLTAQGLEVIRLRGKEKDQEYLQKIVEQNEVKEVVVGLPKNMNGTEGEQAKKVRKFIKDLEENLGLSIKTWDERLTSVAAEKVLLEADLSRAKRKKVIDKVAATIILQGYLDARREKGTEFNMWNVET